MNKLKTLVFFTSILFSYSAFSVPNYGGELNIILNNLNAFADNKCRSAISAQYESELSKKQIEVEELGVENKVYQVVVDSTKPNCGVKLSEFSGSGNPSVIHNPGSKISTFKETVYPSVMRLLE